MQKRIRGLLSLWMAALMALTLCPVTVRAEYLPGHTAHAHTGTPLADGTSINADGNYHLTSDINNLVVGNDTTPIEVHLCLNGNDIEGLSVGAGATLYLYNCGGYILTDSLKHSPFIENVTNNGSIICMTDENDYATFAMLGGDGEAIDLENITGTVNIVTYNVSDCGQQIAKNVDENLSVTVYDINSDAPSSFMRGPDPDNASYKALYCRKSTHNSYSHKITYSTDDTPSDVTWTPPI